jgi:hypothetical protein
MLALGAFCSTAFAGLVSPAPTRAYVQLAAATKAKPAAPAKTAAKKVLAKKAPPAKKVVAKKVVAKKAPPPAAAKKAPPKKNLDPKKQAFFSKLEAKKAADKKQSAKLQVRPARAQWDRKPPKKGQVVKKSPPPKEFAYGLPGNFNALGGGELNFDPNGFLVGKSELEVNRYRECELTHGRVGMLASLGFLVQEGFHPLFSGVGGPAIDQIPQLPAWLWFTMGFGVTFAEFYRISVAFRELDGQTLQAETALRPGYVPGQIGFDPLGIAPTDPAEFRIMQEKELAHARLAMIAAAGFLAQEAVTKTTWAVADGL